ncbi:MAG: DNA polymerase IV [Planctomycetota bacterium]
MILHIDMDAFYASIEQRDHPEYRGRPVVVGGTNGRGVVSAASYEARRFGIHSAMSGRQARQLCPDAVFVKGRLDYYFDVGRQVREIFQRFTPLVQALSCDEAFLDVTGTIRLFGGAASIGRQIKQEIASELQLGASVGIAPLKFVAKIASDLDKPNGFVEVPVDGVLDFLDPLPVSRLWGVGKVGERKLLRLGLRRMKDIRLCELKDLQRDFGAWGEHLWRLANGIDPRAVVPDREAKQIGHERTFAEDVSDDELLRSVVNYLTQAVTRRLRRGGRLCRTVSLKYRREDFRTFARSQTLSRPSDSSDVVYHTAIGLLESMRQREPRPVRLIGVSLGSLVAADTPRQLSLFDIGPLAGGSFEPGVETEALRHLDRVSDEIQDRVGEAGVYRGSSHRWMHRKKN